MIDKDLIGFYWRVWNYRLIKEPLEIKILLRYLKPGSVAVDIGAYKGAYAYWMSRAVGNEGMVYAFDPQKYVYGYLRDIISKIDIKNIILEPVGLSSKDGEIYLAIPEGKRECSPSATFEIKDDERYETYRVSVKTLDNYFKSLGANKIDFIKCDAEGHELEIFRGGIEILKRDKPVLLFECEQRHLKNHKIDDVFDFLKQLGYRGEFICKNKLYPLSEFKVDHHQVENRTPYVNNFLFVVDSL